MIGEGFGFGTSLGDGVVKKERGFPSSDEVGDFGGVGGFGSCALVGIGGSGIEVAVACEAFTPSPRGHDLLGSASSMKLRGTGGDLIVFPVSVRCGESDNGVRSTRSSSTWIDDTLLALLFKDLSSNEADFLLVSGGVGRVPS